MPKSIINLKLDYDKQTKIVTDLRKQLKKQESILKNMKNKIISIEKYNNIVKNPNKYLLWKFLKHFWTETLKYSPSYERRTLTKNFIQNIRKRGGNYFTPFSNKELNNILIYICKHTTDILIYDLQLDIPYKRRIIDNFFAQDDVMKYLIKTHLNQTNQSDHSETS